MIDFSVSRLLLAGLLAPIIGCTSQQLYTGGQEWQRNECRRLPMQEQERCLSSTAMSYQEYERQRQDLRKSP